MPRKAKPPRNARRPITAADIRAELREITGAGITRAERDAETARNAYSNLAGGTYSVNGTRRSFFRTAVQIDEEEEGTWFETRSPVPAFVPHAPRTISGLTDKTTAGTTWSPGQSAGRKPWTALSESALDGYVPPVPAALVEPAKRSADRRQFPRARRR